jgi:hypothetical protein
MGNSTADCIVRVTGPEDSRFLKSDCGQALECTDTPSYALFVTYEQAAAWVARLRKKGYPRAVVCDTRGYLMTFERLQARQRAEAEATDDLPRSWADYLKIPVAEVRRRYKVDSAFADAVDQIEESPRPAPKPKQNDVQWPERAR